MKIRLQSLTLLCRRSREVVRFSPQLSFFHGGIGAGKSSIARLIDFCLGGDLERTQAIVKELVSVELAADIGSYSVLFEREAHGSNQVQITWKSESGESESVLASQHNSGSPILGNDVYNVSDLIFHLAGITPIKVRRSKQDESSPLIRLSFRDVMWYCYLEQDHLDSSFFRLSEPIVLAKSRDVMRFVVGFYTDRLQELEIRLEQVQTERANKLEASRQFKSFLDRFGFGTEQEIAGEIEHAKDQLKKARERQQQLRDGFTSDTHFVDELRDQLRVLSDRLNEEQQTFTDLSNRLNDQQSLKAELTTARFKLARAESASEVLKGVRFEACPACGTKVQAAEVPADNCYLCGSPPDTTKDNETAVADSAKRDIEARIEDLSDSIDRSRRAVKRQSATVDRVRASKVELDQRLVVELKNYDSAFVAETRKVDDQIATLVERLKNLKKLKELPEAIELLQKEADELHLEEERIKRRIAGEKEGLTSANEVIEELERAYLDALLKVGMPGVTASDSIFINRKSWIPSIQEGGDEALSWSFFNTGSGGKKTLLNVCYALALHAVAAEKDLPLPRLLMIDTPMKNIGEEVNRNVFVAFYEYLYRLIEGPLSKTQVIIIDKEYIAPTSDGMKIVERYMTPDQDEHPPLITYYRGP